MVKIQTIHSFVCDVQQGAQEVNLQKGIMHQDAMADVFRVEVMQGGQRVDLTGVSVHGYLYVAQTRQTLPLAGSVEGNAASVVLTSACYDVPGYASLCLQLHAADVRHTLLKANFCIGRTGSDQIIDPEGVLPSLPDLLAEIDNMRAATATAEAAANNADQAATNLITAALDLTTSAAPAIVQDVDGDGVVSVSDSAERLLTGMHVYGKTTQDGTPTPEAPVPMVHAGADGSIGVQVCGKNLFDLSKLWIGNNVQCETNGNSVHISTNSANTYSGCRVPAITMHAGIEYVLSADVSDIVSGTPSLGFRDADTMKYIKRAYVSDGRIVLTYTPTETIRAYAYLLVTGSTASDGDATFANIQLEVSASATAYEPYKDGGSMTIATPNGLPGLPVDSGGNYTDASGQQWICDEIDFTRGTYIKRIGSLTMDGSQICAWTSYPTMPNAGYLFCSLSEYDAADPQYIAAALSDSFINRAGQAAGLFDHGSFRLAVDSSALTFSLDGVSNTSAAMQWFKEHPATFLYVREHPAGDFLSADELAAFAALKSQYPHTTVYTDGDAGMTLSYIADTKRYIDNKFAALAAASVDA